MYKHKIKVLDQGARELRDYELDAASGGAWPAAIVNGIPSVSVGASGYTSHVPIGIPPTKPGRT